MPNENDIIKLKNSNPLIKYPVDADQLNHNFDVINKNQGAVAIKDIIESSGQVYTPIIDNQLAMAVAQYVFSCTLFIDRGTQNVYKLYPRDGFSLPYKYTYGMELQFVTEATNTGECTIQIGSLDPYPLLVSGYNAPEGFISQTSINKIRFMGSYWEPVTYTSSSTGSSSGGGSSSGDLSLIGVIKTAITTAGIEYDQTNNNQLAQSISTYVSGICYNSTYENNIYTLIPQNNQATPTKYFDGMLLFFYPSASNSTANPGIKLGNLVDTAILDYNGQIISSNYISAGTIVAVKYTDGAFRILSDYMPAIVFGNGKRITSVSNDASLYNESKDALVTEYAVKKYVDSNIRSSNENTIISGYTENGSPAALNAISKHQVQLKSTETGRTVVEFTPNDSADIIASSNQTTAKNAIDKFNTTFWETAKTGFLIDDKKRKVSGEQGAKYIDVVYNSEGEVEYLHSPAEPEWIGFKNLSKLPDVLCISMTDDKHTPTSIRAEVNTSATLEQALWMPLVTQDGDDNTQYVLNYGNFTLLTKDDNGYYTVELPKTVYNGSTVEKFTNSGNFAIRFVVESTANQYPTTEQVNSPGYDPNTDRTSEQYTWQIQDMFIGNIIENVPQFSIVYPSGKIENITSSIYYTQYILSQEDTKISTLDNLSNGRYILYKRYGSSYMDSVLKQKVSYQSSLPTPSETTVGNLCIVISTQPYKTYICVQSGDTYVWEEDEFMLLGGFDVANNSITSVINYSYGTIQVKDFDFTKNFDNTIQHNFGSDVRVSCLLVCSVANNGYSIGDQVSLYPSELYTYELTGNLDDGYSLSSSLSLFSIVNTNITTKVKAINYLIPNKDTGALVSIPDNSWMLRVYINKE